MLIDFHTHVFPDALAPRAIPKLAHICQLTPQTDGTVTDTLSKQKNWQVDCAVFQNIATKKNQESTINAFAQSIRSPRLIPFAALHYQSDHIADVVANIKKQGFIGVKLHHDYQNVMADDPACYPMYDACSQQGLYVMFHAGFDYVSPNLVHAPPKSLKKVITDFPHLKAIFAHLGGIALWDEVESDLAGLPVYMDTSICAGRIDPALMKSILQKHDSQRILFGSDCPWQTPAENLAFLQTLGLSADYLDNIMYKNAQQILSLS